MLCVLMVEGMSGVVNVMLSLISAMIPPPALCKLSVCTVVKLCTMLYALGLSLVSWIVMICSCVVNKHFELLEFVFNSVYVA